jgi:hypothetical protein
VAFGEDFDFFGMPLLVSIGFIFAIGLADGVFDVFSGEPILAAQLSLQLIQHLGSLGNLLGLAGESQLVITIDQLHLEAVADQSQIPICRPKQGQLLPGLFEANAQVHGDGNLPINQLPNTIDNCRC